MAIRTHAYPVDEGDDHAGEPREPVMRHYVPTRADRAAIVPHYRTEPFVTGIRGWDNRPYDKGSALAKFYIRTVARRPLPGLWI